MKNINRNIKVVAVNNEGAHGFSIYLDFSGQKEFLMVHRHNGLLYQNLKDGVCLADINRTSTYKLASYNNVSKRNAKIASAKLEKMVRHLNSVIDEYMDERAVA